VVSPRDPEVLMLLNPFFDTTVKTTRNPFKGPDVAGRPGGFLETEATPVKLSHLGDLRLRLMGASRSNQNHLKDGGQSGGIRPVHHLRALRTTVGGNIGARYSRAFQRH
jgi:hypothetical protein